MKTTCLTLFLLVFFFLSCGDKKSGIDSSAGYITIEINNKNPTDYTRFVLRTNDAEETFDVAAGQSSVKKFKAIPGTLYSLRAIRYAENIQVKITDNKGKTALNVATIIYSPGHGGAFSLLDFIALIYDPNDPVEDPSAYKIGFAKDVKWLREGPLNW